MVAAVRSSALSLIVLFCAASAFPQHGHHAHHDMGPDEPSGAAINGAVIAKGDCPEETSAFTVEAPSLTSFRINGSLDPDITLQRGHSYAFSVNTPGHPFNIKTAQVVGTASRFNDGVTNQGTQSGTLTFVVPLGAPDNLFYQCGNHSPMTGNLLIVDACVEEGEAPACHSADFVCDNTLSLAELLRFIQLYNSGALHCQGGTEDGYAAGAGDENCAAHAGDYAPQDWLISLSETLRVIQLFNIASYSACEGVGEDGYCV